MADGAFAPDHPIEIDGCATVGALFAKRCRDNADRTAHREKDFGVWKAYSWAYYWDHAKWTGMGLMALGVQRGDVVSILSEDRREWLYYDMGVMGIRIFAGGFLATDQRHGREIPLTVNADEAPEAARTAELMAAIEGEYGDRAQKALRFGLASDLLSTIVIGVGEDWHFAHALEALGMGPLPHHALADLAKIRASDPAFAS